MIEEKTKVPNRSAEEREKRRLDREAAAVATVKGMIKSPSAPDLRPMPLTHTSLPGDQNAPGVVYFVYCANRIKIGFTTDVSSRLSSMASNCPMPITLLLTIGGSEQDERAYHEMFVEDRVNLEWFNLSYEMRDFLLSKFECGTFELMMQAEHDCQDFFFSGAKYMADVFVDPFGEGVP